MATKSGPGKSYRRGITLMDAVKMFDTEEKAEAWFTSRRWPDGPVCPHCEGLNIQSVASRKPQPYRCRTCRKFFSVKTDTLLHSSNIPLSKWAIAFYLHATSLKGVSSMKLHRDLGIAQSSAWYMGHRIREMWNEEADKFAGAVEVDETYIGGKEGNKHESKKLKAGRGTVGKAAVVGVKQRATGRVNTEVVKSTDKATLQNFVIRHTIPGTIVYTDEAAAYQGIPRPHESVNHSANEYVRDMAHTQGMDSHWAMFKRAIDGTFHHISVKHLGRYSTEFDGRHNCRPLDTEEQMGIIARGAAGKRMTYASLIGPAHTRQPKIL
jgi:transposase-like protein